jgi:hypothetical protein
MLALREDLLSEVHLSDCATARNCADILVVAKSDFEKYKARIIVKGFSQIAGLDFEVFTGF